MKTKAIVFRSSHTIRLFKSLNIPIIAINNLGEQVQFMGEVVSLVVVLHRSLSWEPQVNHTSKKSNRALFGLKFIRSYFTLLLMYRIVRMKEPPIPINLIDRTEGLERTSTLPNYHQKNFRHRYAKLRNSVPQNTRDLPYYSRFKGEIRRQSDNRN